MGGHKVGFELFGWYDIMVSEYRDYVEIMWSLHDRAVKYVFFFLPAFGPEFI